MYDLLYDKNIIYVQILHFNSLNKRKTSWDELLYIIKLQ
jgi:hypothetical protein